MVLNASDDLPATNIDVAKYASKLLKKKLSAVPLAKFKNKMIKEFYKDSKKVSNKNMKNTLKNKVKVSYLQARIKKYF